MLFYELKGQTLQKIELVDGVILLETDKITGKLTAFGDCCSNGWLGDLVPIKLPSKITDTNDYSNNEGVLDKNDPRYPEHGDVVTVYAATITTEAGVITFNVFNDSNGYYGSSLEFEQLTEK